MWHEVRLGHGKVPSSIQYPADPSAPASWLCHLPPPSWVDSWLSEAFTLHAVTLSSPGDAQRRDFPELITCVCRHCRGYHWCLVINDTNNPWECSTKDLSSAHQSKSPQSQSPPKNLPLFSLLINNIIVFSITHIWKCKVVMRFYLPPHTGQTVDLDRTLYFEIEKCHSSWSLHTRTILDKMSVPSHCNTVDGQ